MRYRLVFGPHYRSGSHFVKLAFVCSCFFFFACTPPSEVDSAAGQVELADPLENEASFRALLSKHLKAVSEQDIETVKETLPPDGVMYLILPGMEMTHSVDEFVALHEEWFAAVPWTFETKILKTHVQEDLGMAIVEVMYREPDRGGRPYFNRQLVSYDLIKVDGNWFVFKDQACSIEKTQS